MQTQLKLYNSPADVIVLYELAKIPQQLPFR